MKKLHFVRPAAARYRFAAVEISTAARDICPSALKTAIIYGLQSARVVRLSYYGVSVHHAIRPRRIASYMVYGYTRDIFCYSASEAARFASVECRRVMDARRALPALPAKSSAPRTIRAACTRRENARKKRLDARVERTARIAEAHAPAPSVLCPETWRTKTAARVVTWAIEQDAPKAKKSICSYKVDAHSVTVYRRPDGIYTAAPVDDAAPVSVDIPAKTITGDATPAYRRPATPYSGTAAELAKPAEHPGIKSTATAAPAPVLTAEVTSSKVAKNGIKASYAAQHQVQQPLDTSPLWRMAWGCAVHVIKRRIEDTIPRTSADAMRGDAGFNTFTALYYQGIADNRTLQPARANIDTLLDATKAAAANLAEREKLAKLQAKAKGLSGFLRAQYINDETAAARAVLKTAKERVRAAEKLDSDIIADFEDIQSAAYTAGFDLCTKYNAFLVRNGKKPFACVDCQEIIDALIAVQEKDKPELAASKAAMDAAKDAARAAGYTRWLDFAPYRAALEQTKKFRRRSITIVMCSAARQYIGSRDHGGRSIAVDIDGAARRADQVTSAENSYLHRAINNSAKNDSYTSIVAEDLLRLCPSPAIAECLRYYMDGYTQTQIAATLGCSQKTVSNYIAKARAAISSSDCYKDAPQVIAYLEHIAAKL